MCGPSGQEEALASQEGSLSTTLMNAFNDRLGKQTDILSQVQDALGQLKSGNFPPGYSPSVMSSLQTNVLNQVAGATRSAQQAAGNAFAAQGGPLGAGAGSPLASGVQAQVRGDIAATGAAQQANLLNALNIKSFDLGRENLIANISGLQTLAGQEAPLDFAKSASGVNETAFGQEKTINQQKNQMWADIAGGITGVAKTALGFVPGLGTAAKAGLGVLGGGISNAQENSIGNAASSNYSDWTSSLGAPADWTPGE